MLKCVTQGQLSTPRVPEQDHGPEAEMPAHCLQIRDRARDREGPGPVRAPSAALVPPDHAQPLRQHRGQGPRHVPQPGAAVADDDRVAFTLAGRPQPEAVIGEY